MIVIVQSIEDRVTIAGLTPEQFAGFCALVDAGKNAREPFAAQAASKLASTLPWAYHRPTQCFALWELTWDKLLAINAILLWAVINAGPDGKPSLADEIVEAIDVAVGMGLRLSPPMSKGSQ